MKLLSKSINKKIEKERIINEKKDLEKYLGRIISKKISPVI
jgi:hypothetical protein